MVQLPQKSKHIDWTLSLKCDQVSSLTLAMTLEVFLGGICYTKNAETFSQIMLRIEQPDQ